jgi:hypothetical protein
MTATCRPLAQVEDTRNTEFWWENLKGTLIEDGRIRIIILWEEHKGDAGIQLA